ncbi:MAG TPA: efflux RND transporter periplasmic adaptor subunit [Thermoanaerobaculia bacterium]|nr:efflux RND transporter periplasmic adaptor subunit [Thermoanaerobaculia bacterium]
MKTCTVLLALIVSAGLIACGGSPPQPAPANPTTEPAPPPPLPEDVAALAAGLARPEASATAPTPAAALSEITGELVSPLVSQLVAKQAGGRVAAVLVDAGDRVAAGQPLLRLETDYRELEVARARAELSRVRTARDEAERELARKRELLAKGSIPQALHDRTLAARDEAAAGVEAAEAALALAEHRLADATLLAPFAGAIAERRADVGEFLGEGSVAFVLVQLSPLRLRFELPERELGRVRRGQQVEARMDAFPGEVFRGRVRTVGATVDPESRTFTVEAELDNRDGRLKPGLFARVTLPGGGPDA